MCEIRRDSTHTNVTFLMFLLLHVSCCGGSMSAMGLIHTQHTNTKQYKYNTTFRFLMTVF